MACVHVRIFLAQYPSTGHLWLAVGAPQSTAHNAPGGNTGCRCGPTLSSGNKSVWPGFLEDLDVVSSTRQFQAIPSGSADGSFT